MTQCFLSEHDIRKLDRDLRILIATNGTLTRILEVVADEEIVVHILEQQIYDVARKTPALQGLATGRVLRRRILLRGGSTGKPLVAAESLVAVDLLPGGIVTGLTTTRRPIGEVITASCLESFKEPPQVWRGQLPDWLVLTGCQISRASIVGRRYRIISGGQPVLVITEFFVGSGFPDTPHQDGHGGE